MKREREREREFGKTAHSARLDDDDDIRGAYDKFPDFLRMGTFIDSTHMNL